LETRCRDHRSIRVCCPWSGPLVAGCSLLMLDTGIGDRFRVSVFFIPVYRYEFCNEYLTTLILDILDNLGICSYHCICELKSLVIWAMWP
jgi:hypothetical protein